MPGSKLYRTGLGPETEIADIVPPHRVIGLGDIDFGRIEFNSDPVNPKNKYEYDTIVDWIIKLLFEKKKVGLNLEMTCMSLWRN